jgi:hypothetical protein
MDNLDCMTQQLAESFVNGNVGWVMAQIAECKAPLTAAWLAADVFAWLNADSNEEAHRFLRALDAAQHK